MSSLRSASAVPKRTAPLSEPNNPISRTPVEKPVPSSTPSRNSGGTANELPEERKRATFDVNKMIEFLDGGEEMSKKKKFIRSPLEDKDYSDMHKWDRSKLIAEHIDHFIGIHKKFAKYRPTRQEVSWMIDSYMLKGSLMNHHGLFLMTLQSMASDEQKDWWFFKALRFEIIGCYAQTELKHGSNVRGLSTTATFDKATQEFVLHTPDLGAMKFWPGTLGKLCTHALVFAQLILNGKEHGVHVFMVQIRDENHTPLPGIEVGDLGNKMGDHANDTGFLRLTNVRVPRQFLLAAYQTVSPDGVYVKSEKKTNPRLVYSTMMYTRGMMISGGAGALAKAATIATRYSCVRKQGFQNPAEGISYKSPEFKLADHQVQRYRLFRQIGLTFILKFVSHWMLNKFGDLESGGDRGIIVDTKNLLEIAASSAGLKALTTIMVANGIEDLRKACGGNGYLQQSGIAMLASDYLWQSTAEGDFIVMILLTARFLLKALVEAKSGKKPAGATDYLAVVADPKFTPEAHAPPQPKSEADFFDLKYLVSLFRYRALCLVVAAGFDFQGKLSKGAKFHEAFNSCALELSHAVTAHCLYFMLNQAVDKLGEAQDPSVKAVLEKLFAFYACSNIIDDNWGGLITMKQLHLAKLAACKLLDQLRPDAVALVDSFDIPDNILNSTLGKYDGNVYEAIFEQVLSSELNQSDPFDGYDSVLRPHLNQEFLKVGNKLPLSKM